MNISLFTASWLDNTVWILSLSSLYCRHKIEPKNNSGRKRCWCCCCCCYCFALFFKLETAANNQKSGKEIRARAWRQDQDQKQNLQRKLLPACSSGLIQFTFLHKPGPKELCTHALIPNLENYLQNCLQANPKKQFLNRDSFPSDISRFLSS